jgi:hypothetical protein
VSGGCPADTVREPGQFRQIVENLSQMDLHRLRHINIIRHLSLPSKDQPGYIEGFLKLITIASSLKSTARM